MSAETRQDSAGAAFPVIIMLGILVVAAVMTFIVPSGSFQRAGGLVVPGSYQEAEKEYSADAILGLEAEADARRVGPVGPVKMVLAIPEGIARVNELIVMVLMIGGMFGVLQRTGALDAALDRLVARLRGNVYVLVPALMLILSAGSTFLGFAKEYLLVIPLMVAMANRLGLSNLVGLAIVLIAVKAGYIASVTNPIPLSIAQPLVGVPVFSGAAFRALCWLAFLAIGAAFLLWMIRRERAGAVYAAPAMSARIAPRQKAVLAILAAGIALLVFAATRWQWSHTHLAGYYIALSIVLAGVAGIGAGNAADAFMKGMQHILMAALLIGLAAATTITLENGMILDTIVNAFAQLIGRDTWVGAYAMYFTQMSMDVLTPSTSGQAALTMPIMAPLGQLADVPRQTTVLAFLLGHGITNLVTPTSSALLAFLATARVSWAQWFRFAWRLWVVYVGVGALLLAISVIVESSPWT